MKIIVTILPLTLFALTLTLTLPYEVTAENNRVVCYYGSWAVYRPGHGKFDVEDIDPTLCSHLIYTFVGLGSNGKIEVLDAWNDLEEDYGLGAFKRFVKLKQRNPAVKTMVAIGGWNEGSTKYSKMVSDDGLRATFVKSAVNFLQKYGFDGLDIDWEYPNQRGGKPSDVINYVKLIKELRDEFDKHGLLLTAAVAAAEFSMSLSYDVPMLSKYLDFINVMAYDLHGTWDGFTGNNAPLYPSSKDVEETSKQLNVIACINTWIKKGADPSKLVLGMGTYGRSFTLDKPQNTGLYSPSGQPGAPGKYTEEAGMLGYNEIVENSDWTEVWDDEQKVPYAFKGNQWVGFDNPKSLTLKMEFAKKMGLGGGMIWSIDTDDFLGISGTKFPLLRAINEALQNEIPTESPTTQGPSTTHKPTKTTTHKPTGPTEPTTPNPNDPALLCKEANTYVRDPNDCSKFYFCVLVDGKFKTFEFNCGKDMVFDPKTNSCNYPWLVEC